MQLLLVAGILLAAGKTLGTPLTADELDQFVKALIQKKLLDTREKLARGIGIEAKTLKPNINLKVPEVQCGIDYTGDAKKINNEVFEKYPDDFHKLVEELEIAGEETYVTCVIPTRDEINCDRKVCEGRALTFCSCGPKKCKLDSDGLCEKKGSEDGDTKKDDEEDGSSSLFVFGTIANLTIFYLISSFF